MVHRLKPEVEWIPPLVFHVRGVLVTVPAQAVPLRLSRVWLTLCPPMFLVDILLTEGIGERCLSPSLVLPGLSGLVVIWVGPLTVHLWDKSLPYTGASSRKGGLCGSVGVVSTVLPGPVQIRLWQVGGHVDVFLLALDPGLRRLVGWRTSCIEFISVETKVVV